MRESPIRSETTPASAARRIPLLDLDLSKARIIKAGALISTSSVKASLTSEAAAALNHTFDVSLFKDDTRARPGTRPATPARPQHPTVKLLSRARYGADCRSTRPVIGSTGSEACSCTTAHRPSIRRQMSVAR